MGPQSALTDFLAANNISANQIRLDADQRRRAAAEQAQQNNDDGELGQQVPEVHQDDAVAVESHVAEPPVAGPSTRRRSRRSETQTQQEKRKKEEAKAIEKIKASKRFQKRKRGLDDSDDEEAIAHAIFNQSRAPLPGQIENCARCNNRFTVTPYSRAAPDGGLLCPPCGRKLEKEKDTPEVKKKKKRGPAPGQRRKVQSNLLDGASPLGPKLLTTLCIETLAKNIDLAEDLGDLPPTIVDKIGRWLSKRRLTNNSTYNLFLQPTTEEVTLYEGAKLTPDDLIRVFQTLPRLRKFLIRNGVQFKDEVMDYILSRDSRLEEISIHGANLLSASRWSQFIIAKGDVLQSLKVYYTDRHFGDDSVALLKTHCPALKRLKIMHNQEVSDDGVKEIASVKSLEHVSLWLQKATTSEAYVTILNGIGKNLRTFSIHLVPAADDSILEALHNNCRTLSKLRITDSEEMTDAGFVKLFNGWANRGLVFIDLQKCRQLDASHPRENPTNIGLCSDGFRALMAHSGQTIRNLNVHACRFISREAFEDVFSAGKVYPELRGLEVSFCPHVDDFVVGSIFRSCPQLKQLNVFGCMDVKGEIKVPRGKILVGVPNAKGMQIEGEDD